MMNPDLIDEGAASLFRELTDIIGPLLSLYSYLRSIFD